MRMGFSLEICFQSGSDQWRRKRDTFYFSASRGRSVLTWSARGPGPHLPSERWIWVGGALLSSWTLEIDSLSPSLVSQNPPLPPHIPKRHTQAPYLCLQSHFWEKVGVGDGRIKSVGVVERQVIWDNSQHHSTHVLAPILKSRAIPSFWVTFQSSNWSQLQLSHRQERNCCVFSDKNLLLTPSLYSPSLSGRGCITVPSVLTNVPWWLIHRDLSFTTYEGNFLCLRPNFPGWLWGLMESIIQRK